MEDKSFTIRVSKRWARVALIVGVTVLIVAPLTVVASHVFNDVPDSHTFHGDITWLADAGVTKGCNPPANDQFCPDEDVTRGQMSAFMRRFAQFIGAEDGTPSQADHAATANSADTADNLDGIDSSGFMRNTTVVLSTPNTAWTPNQGSPPSSGGAFIDASQFSADGTIQLGLPTPALIGGTTFGLESLEVCYRVSESPGFLGNIAIRRGTEGTATHAFVDDTDRTSSSWDCFTVEPDLLPGKGLTLVVSLHGGGTVLVGNVTATWTSDVAGMTSEAAGGAVDMPGTAVGD